MTVLESVIFLNKIKNMHFFLNYNLKSHRFVFGNMF